MSTDAPSSEVGVADEGAPVRAPGEPPSRQFAGGRFGGGMPAERSEDFGGALRRLLGTMRPERAGALAVLVCAVAAVALSVIGPRLLGRATDVIVRGVFDPSAGGIDTGRLRQILIQVIVLYLASSVLTFLQTYLLAGVVQRTMRRLRSEVEDKLHRLPLAHVDRTPRGDLLSRVTNDIDNLAQSLQQTLSQLVTSALTIVGVLAMMFWISWELGLLALLTVPVSLWIVRTVARRSKTRFVAQWGHTGALNAQVEEAFTGHALVKVFGQQDATQARFEAKNEELYEASFGAQFLSGIIQPAMMFLGNLNFVAIAVIGGLRVSSGSMTIGDVQAFIQYSRQFTQPLTQMASMINVLQSGVASAERVFQLLDVEEQAPDPELEPRPAAGGSVPADEATDRRDVEEAVAVAVTDAGGDRPVATRGRIEFEHVSFAYDPAKPLIQDLSLLAEPGQTVAIVGPTGAGKTTLVNLIMRFYELDSGRITLDGRDIAEMSRSDLRSQVGMVLQDTWLFGGTIRENLAYGNLDASEDQILEAAQATYVDRFVHSLPDGYDTVVDDEGGSVSAGEKQLLTIARAFLADPTILILDEATSSVDTRTEVLIQRAMAALRSQRTSFVIAHRLSTIRDADLILVMEAGSIVEQGDHQSLLAAEGAYAALYQSQFQGPANDQT